MIRATNWLRMNRWRTQLDQRDPDYMDPPEENEEIEPDDEQYQPDIDYQGERDANS